MQQYPNLPPSWGDDQLSKFIQGATENTYASFHNLKECFHRLNGIHLAFDKAAGNMDRSPELLSSFFLFRSHSAYLAAVRLALSGQVPEAYMVLRGALECALYGVYVARKPSVQEVWLRRHDDEAAKKRAKSEFRVSNTFEVLESEDQRLRNIAGELYERTIDFGGHPNALGLLSVMKQESDEIKYAFQSAYMTENEESLHLCLKSCGQIGICALSIFRKVFRERFDILGISNEISALKQGL